MSSLPELYGLHAPSEVPWDRARERQVLDRALASSRRRARRMRALELSAAALAIAVLTRVSMPPAATNDAVEPAASVPEAELEAAPSGDTAITPPGNAAERSKSMASGGFAGTGGHGGSGSTGLGGSAGTG